MPAPLVVASNRGPVSYRIDDQGRLTCTRGAGGLVTGLAPVLESGEATWVCAAISDGDRLAASRNGGRLPPEETGGASVRMLDLDPLDFARAYNGVANGTLWFVHHHLYATATQPVFDSAWRRLWGAYARVNAAFADALAEEAAPGASVLVQDYHLFLVPRLLRERRPDLRIGHFTHTPWADESFFALLPDDVRRELLLGLLGADLAAFQTRRWATAFECCCAAEGLEVGTRIGVHPIGIDAEALRERTSEADVVARRAAIERWAAGRKVVLRVDRTELSKNIVRGLLSFGELLRTRPEWRREVVHLAFAYPSRHDLPEYREYTGAVQRAAAAVNDELSEPGWTPVRLEVSDDYPRSLAALSLADVLVVNPVRDGMNLVAKEGPVLSGGRCGLVLSREAGAADELGEWAHLVNPFDVGQTAAAIDAALRMPPSPERVAGLEAAARAHPPQEWFAAQLSALADPHPP